MVVIGIIALFATLLLVFWPCEDGFSGQGVGSCDDIDECAEETHSCHEYAVCKNTVGSWDCKCNHGYEGTGDQCKDLDECSLGLSFENSLHVLCIV